MQYCLSSLEVMDDMTSDVQLLVAYVSINSFVFIELVLRCTNTDMDSEGEEYSLLTCEAVRGVIAEVFCIYDYGSPGAVRETC